MAVIILVVAACCAVIAFARADVIDPEPWGYLSLMVALLAAVAAGILTFVQTYFESSIPEDDPPAFDDT